MVFYILSPFIEHFYKKSTVRKNNDPLSENIVHFSGIIILRTIEEEI